MIAHTYTFLSINNFSIIFNGNDLLDNYSLEYFNVCDNSFLSVFIPILEKSVIYIYPENKPNVNLKVHVKDGGLSCTYPRYNKQEGLNIVADVD